MQTMGQEDKIAGDLHKSCSQEQGKWFSRRQITNKASVNFKSRRVSNVIHVANEKVFVKATGRKE